MFPLPILSPPLPVDDLSGNVGDAPSNASDLNLPFAEPNGRNTAVHRILRPPPRQFPRTANFMHLLTREYIDWLLRAADTPAVYAETLVSRIE